MLSTKWGDYGLGVLALAVLAYVIMQLVAYITNAKKSASAPMPITSAIPPEVIVALDRNSDAISRLTQLLELQFEFEKERRAEDRARVERLQGSIDRLADLAVKNHQDVSVVLGKIQTEIERSKNFN